MATNDQQYSWDHYLAWAWVHDKMVRVAVYDFEEEWGLMVPGVTVFTSRGTPIHKVDLKAFYALELKRAPIRGPVGQWSATRRWMAMSLPRLSKALFDHIPTSGKFRLNVDKVAAFMAGFDDPVLRMCDALNADPEAVASSRNRSAWVAERRARGFRAEVKQELYQRGTRNGGWGITK